MTVAVVVPCRNEAAHIGGLLDAMAAQTRVPDEIVIVDDRSTDGTADVVRAWQAARPSPPLRVLAGAGQGPGPAMNLGIRATTADIIMRFDGHALPAADYLARCLDVLSDSAGLKACPTYPRVVGGVWHVAAGADTTVARAIAAVVSHPLGSGGAQYRSAMTGGPERVSVETVPFGTFPRVVWEQLDGFDESLAANQDFDFNYRARQAGFNVVLDRRIVATYFARPTLRALALQYFRYGFWKFQMLHKSPRALHPRQLPPAFVLPWVAGTLVAAVVWPGPVPVTAAAVYPLILFAGALHVGLARSVNPIVAAAAMAVVHLSWSAGFWRGVVR